MGKRLQTMVFWAWRSGSELGMEIEVLLLMTTTWNLPPARLLYSLGGDGMLWKLVSGRRVSKACWASLELPRPRVSGLLGWEAMPWSERATSSPGSSDAHLPEGKAGWTGSLKTVEAMRGWHREQRGSSSWSSVQEWESRPESESEHLRNFPLKGYQSSCYFS